ncbi:translocation/assembly module TamB domain-containing protein [Echinicola jeungdonensis]|uniref:Translocation/assembly module TamB domain-containing protein n=1 Tax=Echinicola jeungdonensis TaxID=709343 RepID=A0ABV5J809_9BACT|nr:translocation/assembly module TamB domain-containing protein [Echinicola jeungdonensis]MDN3669736.1 translocation/assembly module TamB domain-containing protein [Echinicola jeungdonensis]
MEKKSKVTEFLLKALKGMLRVTLWVLILFLLVALSLQIPFVQTETIQLLTHQLSENTDFETKIQKVNIRWWDAISLSGLTVHDHQDSLMANLEEVYIDFSIKGLLERENPGIDEIRLKSGKLRIITHEEGELPNISTFIANLNSILRIKKKSEKKKSTRFNIDRITFEETSLDILNYSRPIIEEGFDYNRLRFRNLIGGAENFFTQSDTIGFDILYLRGLESNSGIGFQQLRADFKYSTKAMEFKDLYFKSNQTEIKNYLKFSYENIQSLRDFNNQVDILARLDESVLDIKDLKFFTKNIPDFDDRIYLSGEITGKVSDLYSEELLVRFGERSALFGKFNIEGLPKLDSTYFQLSLVNSSLTSKDLAPYLDKAGKKEINKFKDIRFDSDFTGYLNHFTANGDFRTRIGHIIGKLNYQNTKNQPKYNGRLTLKDLDLGVLMEDPETFQKVSLEGNIKGTGASSQSALLELDANVKKIGINNYNYSGIQTNATYGKDLFKGQLSVSDPNLKINLNGILDLRDGKDSARLTAQLDTAFLKPLNLTEKETFVSGGVELDTKGTHIDEIEGIARFRDLLVSYEGRSLTVDNFFFQSIFTKDTRLISLNSDLLVASITGKFKTKEISKDIQELWKEYYAIITNAELKEEKTQEAPLGDYSIDINMRLNDINPIINLFAPSVYVSKNTQVEGAFYQTQENTIFNFYTGMDTIVYNGHYFLENDLDFNTAKIRNSKEVLAAFYINSKRQQLSSGINFHNLSMEAIWDESAIDFSIGIDQLKTNSYARIESEIEIFNDYTSIVFEPSDIKILDHIWKFSPENSIMISKGQIDVDNLKLSNRDQFLALNGRISPNPEDILSMEINDVNLDFLNTFDVKEYEGIANGTLAFNNLYEKTESNGSLEIRDFHINNFLVGDIYAATYFENERINLQLTNFRGDKKVIEINGYLGTQKEELNLEGNFEEANLSVMEPFLSDYLTEFGGTVSGKINVGGSLGRPEINGAGNLTGGRVRINYLNTLYTVDGKINFSPNEISFRGLNVTDVQGNRAQLRGGIAHDGFKDFILDISSDLDNFQVLNTNIKDNELFYGTAYASGTLDILGAASNLDINANATTEPNTKIYIPIGSTEGQAQEEFINIINVRDTTKTISIEETVEKLAIKNVRMNFTLDVTPDAFAEIQIDPRTGENIQGRGRGILNLNIDTQGAFSMRGDYEIVDAQYNFSLYNVINKQFEILPGGRISWFGNPYEGIMNIKATYEENVSLSSLQNSSEPSPEFENTQLHRRYPVKVIMDLQGQLMSPDINFDFDFSEFPEGEAQTTISAFKNRIANDEQEKNRQVFSLIMMRRFSPEGQFNSAGIGFSNLSQLVSSQLNALISQVDQNLEIDFDLASLDETALESFQLRVAYTFLDGRLRVTRDGTFTDPQGNADLGSIAGDWQAEYLLTDDGRYRIRIYNRNNFNIFTSLNIADRVNTYGVSLSQTLLFSSFKELFQNLRKKRKEKMLINDSDDFLRYKTEEQSEERLITPSGPKSDNTEINILEMPSTPEN